MNYLNKTENNYLFRFKKKTLTVNYNLKILTKK